MLCELYVFMCVYCVNIFLFLNGCKHININNIVYNVIILKYILCLNVCPFPEYSLSLFVVPVYKS